MFAGRLRVDDRDAEVYANEGRLWVDGRAVPFAYAYAIDRVAEPGEPNTVRVVGPGLEAISDVAFETTAGAERLLASMKVDELTAPLTVWAGAPSIPLMVIQLVIGLAMFAGVALAGVVDMPVLFFLPPLITAAAFVAVRRTKTNVTVDAEGVELRSIGGRHRLAWSEVRSVDRLADDALRIWLADEMVRGRTRSRDPIDLFRLSDGGREGLYFLLMRRRALANRAAAALPPSSRHAAADARADVAQLALELAVGTRDLATWQDAIARLSPREAYREHTPTDDALAAVVRAVDVDPSARAAAAVILARRGVEGPRLFAGDVDGAVADALEELAKALHWKRDVAAPLAAVVQSLGA